jgi:hypothetical protein
MKFHQCPVCKRSFEGRKNKLYCSKECKIEYNNSKQTKNLESHRKYLHGLNQNRNMLQKIHDVFGDCIIPISLVNQSKLDMNFMSLARNGNEYHISDFSIIYYNNQYYQIKKIKL